jgi:hypothetical protein
MRLYYGGGEIATHRLTLARNGIKDVYLSYMGLRRRCKFARPWLVDEKFTTDTHVLLDSGAYSVNKGVNSDLDTDEMVSIALHYETFVAQNLERIDAFTEFDALPLGLEWIQDRRDDYYHDLGDKFMPVWHAEHGVEELERMAAVYRRIGVLQTALGNRDLIPVLNVLAERRGTLFHGMSMTKPDIMLAVNFDSVGSTSWISPMQFGDTFVWTGRELKRYPKDYKAEARKRHRTLFTANGFDAAKIAADDNREVVRLSLWSWQHCLADINRRKTGIMPEEEEPVVYVPEDADSVPAPAGDVNLPVPGDTRKQLAVDRVPVLLPGVSFVAAADDDLEIRVQGQSLRRCDTCFLRERGCPGFKAGASCLYEIPIEVKTREQIKALENGLISMQTQRVMFMRMVEDLEGGFPDPNLSNEIDRLTRMIKSQRDGTAEKFSLNINATNRSGELGALSRIFGDKVAEAQAIERTNVVDAMIAETEMGKVFEAEIVE